MPIYDYVCAGCGPFEARRAMRESSEDAVCASCSMPAPREVSAPRLNLMSSANRYAETRNEKSAHEPDVVHRLAPNGVSDSNGHSHRHSHSKPHPAKHKHRPHTPKRPWMLGH